jgi:polyribonucleotide nucleotidyltransferase
MHKETIKIGDTELIFETGRMAKQANGAVLATFGGSVVLATVCCSSDTREGLDFVPLSVEYNEKYYAAGKIPGGFLKREGRPKDKEILVCRLIDRPMRPLFYKDFARELQVVPTTVSTDLKNPPDILGMNAAFAAVYISDIPFNGPIGAVRVGMINGEYVINPTFEQIANGDLDIVVSGSEEGITMVEGGGKEVSEENLLEAIDKAHVTIKEICAMQRRFRDAVGKEKLPIPEKVVIDIPNKEAIVAEATPLLKEASFVKGKFERYAAIKVVHNNIKEKYAADFEDDQKEALSGLLHDMEKDILRESILADQLRTDGRGTEDIRKITSEVNTLPLTHGSALFTRGETQALVVSTLGTVYDEQIKDDIDGDRRSNFMLHYNFPPFSVGETGRMGTGRREIGHGHLAERAITGVLPAKEDFPYTLRIVSEILESNGSSSMATVCGSSLSLLQAGVPIKRPVAGIAMGLVTDGTRFEVLSDILGEEDHLGDMDFKVAGTEKGITAFQMDIKISNVSPEIMKKALSQAKSGRMHILDNMNAVISAPSEEMNETAPKIVKFSVDPDKIGAIIGTGGKNIKSVSEETDSTINIDNDGTVIIYAKNKQNSELAEAKIRGFIEEPEEGQLYNGTVKRLMDFGAFVEILPGKEGLVHISKMSQERVAQVSDVVKEGDEIQVKIIEIDKMGRINLTMIDLDKDLSAFKRKPSDRGGRGRDRDRRGGRDR